FFAPDPIKTGLKRIFRLARWKFQINNYRRLSGQPRCEIQHLAATTQWKTGHITTIKGSKHACEEKSARQKACCQESCCACRQESPCQESCRPQGCCSSEKGTEGF